MQMLFPTACNGIDGFNVSRGDFFKQNMGDDFSRMKPYYLDIWNKTEIKKRISSYLLTVVNGSVAELINELIRVLNEQQTHDCRSARFLVQQGKMLRPDEVQRCAEWLYFFAYFAITHQLEEHAAQKGYKNFAKDLEEYEDQVMLPYGSWGNPGASRTISLATREEPNIIALFEMGEMAYYGRVIFKVPDYDKAYECYSKVLVLNEYHPLANWSIAYMMFNYQRKGKELEFSVVDQFEKRKPFGQSWYYEILSRAEQAYRFGSAAAANLIGNIIDAPENAFPASFRHYFRNSLSIEYFEQSAKRGNIYGMNNYATKLIERAKTISNKEDRERLLKEAVYFFEKSANSGSAWAANKVGCFYNMSFQVENSIIVEKNPELAYHYFMIANRYVSDFDYFWPTINLIKYFYSGNDDRYSDIMSKEEQIKVLNECLDKLNKRKSISSIEVEAEIGDINELLIRLNTSTKCH